MVIAIEKYFDGNSLELMVPLSRGDCFILGLKNRGEDVSYDISVIIPWLFGEPGNCGYGDGSLVCDENLSFVETLTLYGSTPCDLIKYLRKAIPAIRVNNKENDMER